MTANPTLLYLGAEIPEAAIEQRRIILSKHWGVEPKSISVCCEELFLGQKGPSTEQIVAERTGATTDECVIGDFLEIFDPRVNARAIVSRCIERISAANFTVRGIELPFYRLEPDANDDDSTWGLSCLDLLRGNTQVPLLIPRIKIGSIRVPTNIPPEQVIDRTDPLDDGTLWPDPEHPTGQHFPLKAGEIPLFDTAGNVVFSLLGYEERRVI